MVAHGKINTSLCSRVISLSVRTAHLLMKFKVTTRPTCFCSEAHIYPYDVHPNVNRLGHVVNLHCVEGTAPKQDRISVYSIPLQHAKQTFSIIITGEVTELSVGEPPNECLSEMSRRLV